ncbi:hypothetical protein B0H11DRAFT_1956166 [Mycena galericulata]|nr:hypothetical protein B0H11DRAFT_1956166 [Mycena galericulata]
MQENDSLRPNAPDSDQPPENVPSGSKDDGATGEPQASVMGAGKKPQENEDVAGDGVLPKKHVAPEPNDEGASEPNEDVPSQPNNDGASGDPQSNGDIIDASDVPAIDYRIVSKTHFSELDRYLAAYLARAPPNSRSTARQKLTRLTIKQVNELSTDVYDELVRRENEKEVPFLPVREEFHPKRNQARQKLATLPVKRWEDLCSDVHWELIRRYPEFKEAPSELQQANEDTMGATTTQVTHENMDIAGARDPLTEHVAPWLNDKRASEENVPVTSDDELARDQTPENDILAPDEGSNEQPQEDIIISWKDKDEKQYTVSLPVKQCRSWQTFCARLRTQTMPTLPDMKDMEFVAQAEDSKQFLFEEKWADWLSSYDKLSSPHFVLWFIVDHCLCPESNENEDGVCDTCKVPFLDERSLPSRAQEPLPLLEELPLPEELATSEVTGLAEESTPPAVQKDEKQLDLPASPTSPQPDSQITSFRPSDQNSVLRRRRPAAAQNDEDNDSHNQVVTPSVPATSPVIPSQTTEVAARHGRSTLTDIYIYFIAPPFVRLQTTVWKDRELEVRLENRLNAFQGLVWGANAALSATAVALLALTNISNHPVPQSFLILSLIFSLFGFVFTNFLAIHIGDHRKQFAAWLADPANSDESRSLWNPSIMISLPLTWMCWSFLSLGCCSLALGVQILIFDLQSMNTDHFPGQTTSNNSGNSTKSPPQGTNSSTPSTITLSIFQLAVFALAIVWSSVYVVLIYREIRRCMASQNDRGPVSAEEGRGLLTEDE